MEWHFVPKESAMQLDTDEPMAQLKHADEDKIK